MVIDPQSLGQLGGAAYERWGSKFIFFLLILVIIGIFINVWLFARSEANVERSEKLLQEVQNAHTEKVKADLEVVSRIAKLEANLAEAQHLFMADLYKKMMISSKKCKINYNEYFIDYEKNKK